MSESFDRQQTAEVKSSFEKTSDLRELESQSIDNGYVAPEGLSKGLSERLINMIAIAGTIGTGLYLGTGVALARGGPASLLICYTVIGLVVYLTMLSIGEMSTNFPVSGSFGTYAKRYCSPSFGFAILANYWFNDAVSVASDLTALQLVMSYWTDFHYWIISLIFWVFLLFLNVFSVRFYGEAEYWLALLKVLSIIVFFIISIIVNAGKNDMHEYIGFHNWTHGDAPFVDGFKGFASLFVTASFAYGGTESITITSGELKNPIRNTPRIIKTVFWRILFFYVLTVFFVGTNIPYDYPNLSNRAITTSPFTITFQMVGSKAGGSFMNAVIMTSVISAGNHALYAGSRLAFTLGREGYIPKVFTLTNRWKVPYVSVITTWFVGGLCFGSSFIGAGELWNWLQNLVGVSNQLAWWSIGITSIRFRRGLAQQGKTHELAFKNWTYPLGPYFVVIFTSVIILVQGWTAFDPWNVSSFFSYYVELLIFPACFLFWWLLKRDKFIKAEDMDFVTDKYYETEEDIATNEKIDSLRGWAKVKYNLLRYFS